MLIRTIPDYGPVYHTLTFNRNTPLSESVMPLVAKHVLSGGRWDTLFTAAAATNIARGVEFILRTTFDPSRASRLFKKHMTVDSFMKKAAANGLTLSWQEATFVLLCFAKIGITGYDPTFSLRDSITIDDKYRYPTIDVLLQFANAKAFLEQEFYPVIVAAISRSNTHVNDGIVSGEGQMRSYFMGTDVPGQIMSEFNIAWMTLATRCANGSLQGAYHDTVHTSQLRRAIAQRFADNEEYQSRYGQWSGSLNFLFQYSNFVDDIAFKDARDPLLKRDRHMGRTKDELQAIVDSVATVKEGALLEGANRLAEFIKDGFKIFTVTDGITEVGKKAPFTRLSSTSAILPSFDARHCDSNPVVAVADIEPTLYGQCFLLAQSITSGISALVKDAYNLVSDTYNALKEAYVTADAPFTKRAYLDAQTAAAVTSLPGLVQLDAVTNGEDCFVPAKERGTVRIIKQFTGDVASTLAQVGFVGFDNQFMFEHVDEAFTCCATDDRFRAVATESFYGVPMGDEIPFVSTIKDDLIKKYGLLVRIAPDDFRTSVVLPKIRGRKSVKGSEQDRKSVV